MLFTQTLKRASFGPKLLPMTTSSKIVANWVQKMLVNGAWKVKTMSFKTGTSFIFGLTFKKWCQL